MPKYSQERLKRQWALNIHIDRLKKQYKRRLCTHKLFWFSWGRERSVPNGLKTAQKYLLDKKNLTKSHAWRLKKKIPNFKQLKVVVDIWAKEVIINVEKLFVFKNTYLVPRLEKAARAFGRNFIWRKISGSDIGNPSCNYNILYVFPWRDYVFMCDSAGMEWEKRFTMLHWRQNCRWDYSKEKTMYRCNEWVVRTNRYFGLREKYRRFWAVIGILIFIFPGSLIWPWFTWNLIDKILSYYVKYFMMVVEFGFSLFISTYVLEVILLLMCGFLIGAYLFYGQIAKRLINFSFGVIGGGVIMSFITLLNTPLDYVPLSGPFVALPIIVYKALFVIGILFLYLIYLVPTKKFFFKIQHEQFILVLFFLLFGCCLVSTSHLLELFLFLTGFSITLYVLIAQPKHSLAVEAASKYYGLGLVSSAFLLFGVLLLYAEYSRLNFSDLQFIFTLSAFNGSRVATVLEVGGFTFLLLGLLFKLSAFPGFFWAADVYEGSSFLLVSLLILGKLTIFGALVAILSIFSTLQFTLWSPLLILAGLGSVIVGTFGAILQQKLKRFLAFSSISHIGFVLLALAVEQGVNYVSSFYFFTYVAASIVFIGSIVGLRRDNGLGVVYISDLRQIVWQNRNLGILIIIALLSLAGIPPLTGFYSKYLVFSLLARETMLAHIALVICLLLLPVSAFNYLRIIKIMLFGMKIPVVPVFRQRLPAAVIISLFAISNFLLIVCYLSILPKSAIFFIAEKWFRGRYFCLEIEQTAVPITINSTDVLNYYVFYKIPYL